MNKKFGVIILAAGASERMGRPKQTLVFENETLLQRMAGTATSLGCGPVIIVLGANAQLFSSECENAITVINDRWKEGMASSVCCGVNAIMEKLPAAEGVIITVCDQPYITVSLLQKLLDVHQQSQLPIVACSYGNTTGTPVFFHQTMFSELIELKGDKGAKEIIKKNKNRVALVDFPTGTVDLDTEEDYLRLVQ